MALLKISPCQLHTYLMNRKRFFFFFLSLSLSVTCETDIEDAHQHDGMVKKNAPAFRRTAVTEVVGVLDPDEDADVKLAHVAAGSGDTYAGSFSAIPGLSSSEALESWLLQRGVTFRPATGHCRQEQCHHKELESWPSLSELQQQEEREWRTPEPESYAA